MSCKERMTLLSIINIYHTNTVISKSNISYLKHQYFFGEFHSYNFQIYEIIKSLVHPIIIELLTNTVIKYKRSR